MDGGWGAEAFTEFIDFLGEPSLVKLEDGFVVAVSSVGDGVLLSESLDFTRAKVFDFNVLDV